MRREESRTHEPEKHRSDRSTCALTITCRCRSVSDLVPPSRDSSIASSTGPRSILALAIIFDGADVNPTLMPLIDRPAIDIDDDAVIVIVVNGNGDLIDGPHIDGAMSLDTRCSSRG